MTSSLDMQCRAILYAAASAEIGIVVRTNDPVRARLALYKVRRELGDTELAKLQIRVSPTDSEHEIWIIRNASVTVSLDAGAANADLL
jgi:hypothetical protein